MIIPDTHILLWLQSGSSKLGQLAHREAEHVRRADALEVSAISYWGIAVLQARNSIPLAVYVQATSKTFTETLQIYKLLRRRWRKAINLLQRTTEFSIRPAN